MKLAKTSAALAALTAAACATVSAAAADAVCHARSGAQRTALVELYTSEGCSSCPPADRNLAQLPSLLGPATNVAALALHVDYWDGIGWKDPYAQTAFAQRQSRLVQANHHSIVYTPHFFVDGGELRAGSDGLRDAISAADALPPQATLQLDTRWTSSGALQVDLTARSAPELAETALYLALAQNGLSSEVTRGENRGSHLTHEHVARLWSGPLPLEHGLARLQQAFVLPAGADRNSVELVAFVEDTRSGHVLQTLRAPACPSTIPLASR